MKVLQKKTYLCIDLKSFYASVECVDRGLNPLDTHLVVADVSRTEKTICLAVTPSLKSYGISGRARLFEVIQQVKNINQIRKQKSPGQIFSGESIHESELSYNPSLELSYLAVPPRMARYMEYSTKIYEIYLRYMAPEDILVYSIDEVFFDITNYLSRYQMTANQLAETMIKDVFSATGITATAGIGTNLYLAKIAMDITAKKMKPNKNGVRIATLDEITYRTRLWTYQPLSDFWRIGSATAKKLEANRMYCMGDVAKASLSPYGREKLRKLFGINAKMLIDHAWGYEPTTIQEAKAYTPKVKSISSGQVLKEPYSFSKARIIMREMLDQLSLDLVHQQLVTDQLVLTVGYDTKNLQNESVCQNYQGEVICDRYGRRTPKSAHGTVNFPTKTSSTVQLTEKGLSLYDSITNPDFSIRRITLCANRLIPEAKLAETVMEQLSFFAESHQEKKERKLQQTILSLRERYGKNIILKGTSLLEGATAMERNRQIGGHKA